MSSLAVLVADDVAAHAGRLRSAHAALVESVDDVGQERAVLDACQHVLTSGSQVHRRYGRAVRDLQEERLRFGRLLEATVRIGVFDPVVALGR